MPITLKSKWIAALVAAAALLALPAAAQATLTFTRGTVNSTVYVAANNGKGIKKVAAGRNPRVTPDGLSVVYLREGSGHAQEMKLAPVAGGTVRTLMVGWQESFNIAFSPDSQMIAALHGGELGKRSLVLIDVASGTRHTVASGYFSGFSFSPDGTEIVYSKAANERYPARSDVYRAPVAGGKSIAITRDHISSDPLWGPTGKIVFVKQLNAATRKYGPKNELYLMTPQGKGVKRLTHTNVGPLLQGLFPTQWSDNGKRLLAEFGGQDTSYAVAVNPQTGGQRPVVKTAETGFVGTGLSGDGSTVLGFTGGFEPGPNHNVVTVPFAGGKPKVLVKNAYEPAWSD